MITELKAIRHLAYYLYNEEISVVFQLVYGPDMVPHYFKEKSESFWRDRFNWFMGLDEVNQSKLIKAANEREKG